MIVSAQCSSLCSISLKLVDLVRRPADSVVPPTDPNYEVIAQSSTQHSISYDSQIEIEKFYDFLFLVEAFGVGSGASLLLGAALGFPFAAAGR